MDNRENKKRVLLIAYYYYQREMVASNRTRAIFDYLKQFGWDVTLLTVPPKNQQESISLNIIHAEHPLGFLKIYFKFSKKDSWGLVDQKPSKDTANPSELSRIIRNLFSYVRKVKLLSWLYVKIYSLCSLVYFPDLSSGWYKSAVKTARKELKNNKYDAILSTSGPFTSHKIAEKLHDEFGLPWIADYRDLWSQRDYRSFAVSSERMWLERRYEENIIQAASALTTVSKPLADDLEKFHKKKTDVIFNGFDPECVNHGVKLRDKFTITYTGAIYSKESRDPTLLFTALSELIHEGKIVKSDIQVDFYGPYSDWLDDEIGAFNLQDFVVQRGSVPKDEAIALQRSSQILFVLLWSAENGEGVLTGKFFEYLGARRPILATGKYCGGVTPLLEQTKAGYAFSSLEALRTQLLNWYSEYKEKGFVEYRGIDEEVDRYSYREMAKKFSQILDTVSISKRES